MKDKRLQILDLEDIRQQDLVSNLHKAIALLMDLDRCFSCISWVRINGLKLPHESSREYFSFETLFKNQCEKARETDPTFDIEVFAECEKDRIQGILKQVKQLSNESFYSDHPTYKQALKYIKYLLKVINGEIKTDEDNTPKTFLTTYLPNQLDIIRRKSIKAKIFDNISENDFVYLFTGQPILKEMKRLEWRKPKPLCHTFLLRMVYHESHFDYKQVNDCIKLQKGRKLVSQDKSQSKFRHKDILDPIFNI